MKKYWIMITICLLMLHMAYADTYYVSVTGAGSHNGAEGNEFTLSEAMNFANNRGGDIFLLAPGNYGNVDFDRGYGSLTGGYNIYKANPLKTSPRPNNWYEGDLDRPDPQGPGENVIFTNLYFSSHNNWGTVVSLGHYIEVNGINVVGAGVVFEPFVSYARLINCNIFGYIPSDPYYHYFMERSVGVGLYQNWFGDSSDYHDILIDSCYVEFVNEGFNLLGNFSGNVVIRGCHVRDTASGPVNFVSGASSGTIVLEGNHLENQVVKPNSDLNAMVSRVIETIDTLYPRGKLTHNGESISYPHFEWIKVLQTDTGKTEMRKIVAYDTNTRQVTVDKEFSFDIRPGDSAVFTDSVHGSCISLWWSNNLLIKNNIIHDCGRTSAIMFYNVMEKENIVITGNLIYDITNQWTTVLNESPPKSVIFENNTIVGSAHPLDPYGLPFCRNAGNYTAVNNIFVGAASVGGGRFKYTKQYC